MTDQLDKKQFFQGEPEKAPSPIKNPEIHIASQRLQTIAHAYADTSGGSEEKQGKYCIFDLKKWELYFPGKLQKITKSISFLVKFQHFAKKYMFVAFSVKWQFFVL